MDQDCPICILEINDANVLYKTNCNHYYHIECIFLWTESRLASSSLCPYCRQSLDTMHIQTLFKKSNIKVAISFDEFYKLPGVRKINSEITTPIIILNIVKDDWFDQFRNLIVLHKIRMNHDISRTITTLRMGDMSIFFEIHGADYIISKNYLMGHTENNNNYWFKILLINPQLIQKMRQFESMILKLTNANNIIQRDIQHRLWFKIKITDETCFFDNNHVPIKIDNVAKMGCDTKILFKIKTVQISDRVHNDTCMALTAIQAKCTSQITTPTLIILKNNFNTINNDDSDK